jgi:hypothetical protein
MKPRRTASLHSSFRLLASDYFCSLVAHHCSAGRRLDSQQIATAVKQGRPGNLDRVISRVLALGHFLARAMASWFRTISCLSVRPFHAVHIEKKTNLLVNRHHVKAFFHDPPYDGWKEVVPPAP